MSGPSSKKIPRHRKMSRTVGLVNKSTLLADSDLNQICSAMNSPQYIEKFCAVWSLPSITFYCIFKDPSFGQPLTKTVFQETAIHGGRHNTTVPQPLSILKFPIFSSTTAPTPPISLNQQMSPTAVSLSSPYLTTTAQF